MKKPDKKTRMAMYAEAARIKYGGIIDHEVDKFVENGCKGSFDCYKMLREGDVDAPIVKTIADAYRGDVVEIEEVLQEYPGKPRSMMPEESYYGCYTVSQVERLGKFFKDVIRDCESWIDNKTKVKKQANLKLPSSLKNFKYKVSDDDLKIASINPKNLLKAKLLVAISCGTKKDLIILKAASEAGFGINRSSLTNVDYQASSRKTITSGKGMKAVESVIEDVKNGGKRVVNKLMKNEKWKPVANTDIARINSSMILLKVFK